LRAQQRVGRHPLKPLYGYLFFNALGIAVAFGLFRLLRYEIYAKLPEMDKLRVTMGVVLGVVLGAKIPVLLSYGFDPHFFWSGKSLYGSLVGAYTGVNLAKRAWGIPGNYGDRYVIPLCVAVALGDIGCLVNGCCGGLPTDSWFQVHNDEGVGVYPTQIITSAFHLACAGFFYYLYVKKKWFQLHFIIYMFLYSVFRFFIEFIRCEPRVFLGWTVYQWMAVVCAPYFAHVLYRRLRQGIGIEPREALP
jgi:prolipoprotein diacylglyceryltransferase